MSGEGTTRRASDSRAGHSTLRDVAAAAGVSVMTVSNVVNERFGTMTAETRSRVESAIRRLDYRPHASGRNLRLAQALTVGMLIFDEGPTFLKDPFITEVLAGLSNYLSEHGYGLLLQGVKPAKLHRSTLVRHRGTDGLCAMLSGPRDERARVVEHLRRLNQPLVLFQEHPESCEDDVCVVRQDDYAGGRLLAEHLIERGARRLLMIVPDVEWPAVVERERGLRDVVAEARRRGVTHRVLRCHDARAMSETRAALGRDIEEHGLPDAILAGNDQMGIAAMEALAERDRTVPGDVLVTGFNGFEFWQHTHPVLTTVLSPAYELGARGGEQLVRRIARGAFTLPELVLPVTIKVGEST